MKPLRQLFILTLFASLLFPALGKAQQLRITVKDENHKTIPGAIVQLKSFSDSTKKLSASADATGVALWPKIDDGMYIVKITCMGQQELNRNINVKPGQRSFEFEMKKSTVMLGEVNIATAKPLITQVDDKMIIDPKPMASISSNTLEVLESTPGLFVDNEAGIYLNSANPAVVYINGREQKMGKQDVMNLLRNLPPGSVERIEVIKTPGARYDAASSGGIINIILKKGYKVGRFGNFNLGANQGKMGGRFAGFTYNNSGKKSNYYLSGNYNHYGMQEDVNGTRYLGLNDTMWVQNTVSKQTSDMGYSTYGISYEINPKMNFSYDGRIGYSVKKSDALSGSRIQSLLPDTLMLGEDKVNNKFNMLNLSQDFSLTRTLDTSGSVWDNKFSYNFSDNQSSQDYSSVYSIPFPVSNSGDGTNVQQRHFLLFQSDLDYTLPYKIKLETGIKSTWQDFRSSADYFKLSGDTEIPDSSRSNTFRYQEGINAAYLQGSRTLWGGFVLKTGCRLEQTYMKGHQSEPADTTFKLNRADLFPYVFLSRDLPKIMGIKLKFYMIYRKTITRPDYQMLNPYKKYVDPLLYESGNPQLKPQFADNVEMNVSFDDMPVFAVGRNYTHDIFSGVVYSDSSSSNVIVSTYDNLGKSTETYYKFMIGIPPGGRYFFAMGGQYNLMEYNGWYEGKPLQYERGSWRFFTFHSLTLFKETKLTVSGFMMKGGQQGFYELSDFGSLNVGLTRTLMKKNLMITVNARDILHTMKTEFSISQGGIRSYGDRYGDNQRFGINIRYNFGLKKKTERKGLNGIEEDI